MKKLLIALAVSVAACNLAAAQPPAGGMEPPAKKEPMKQEKKELKKIKLNKWKGTVQAIDAVAGRITAADKKGMVMVLPVTAETRIIKNGKPAVLADLKAGDMVLIKYEGGMNAPMVRKIKVKKAPMKKEHMEKPGRQEKMPEMKQDGMKK